MNMHFVVHRVVTIFVRFSIADTRLRSPARKPPGECVRIMIATIFSLSRWGASEFSAPYNQRLVEEAAGFEVS